MAGDLRAMPPERDRGTASVGQRALEFIQWAVDEYGRPASEPGRAVVHCSQAQLTLAYNVGSRGTVAWYIARLRERGIVVSTRPIVVDLAALEQTAGATELGAEELGTDDSPEIEVELASLLARQAAQLGEAIQLLADVAATQADIAQALTTRATPRKRESNSRKFAERRELRESGRAEKEGKEGDFTNLPSFLDANSGRGRATDSRGEVLTASQVDDLVEPLRAWCRRAERSDRLDDNGRRILAPLGRRSLEAGVAAIQREAAGDPAITRPVGLLVDRARRGDPDTFTPPPEPAPQPTARPDCPDCGGSGSITTQRMHQGSLKDYLSPCKCLSTANTNEGTRM